MPFSSRKRSRQRGYEILEFALMVCLLVPTFLWVFINGMNLIRLIQCNQICRDIGNLFMQGVDYSTYQAQQVAATLASGYGLQIGSSYTGSNRSNDTNGGSGWVILSEVMYVGSSACSALPSGTTCTNNGKYVYLMRVDFGNKSVLINGNSLQSAIGNPSAATFNSQGYVQNYLTDANAVATYAGNFITLGDTQVAYICETFFASPTLGFSAYPAGGITSRTFF
ncbi:MAG TPA: hypothetical protein VMT15_09360 [Bryobacteraceae bacterium]|nr:hypothetical protein [Bryobacteraceae bacterium]